MQIRHSNNYRIGAYFIDFRVKFEYLRGAGNTRNNEGVQKSRVFVNSCNAIYLMMFAGCYSRSAIKGDRENPQPSQFTRILLTGVVGGYAKKFAF